MKHAYLIIANRNPRQLQKLIYMIDDSRNDIYLMVDKKSINFPKKFLSNFSPINYLPPINIYWGGYSQIQAELDLFKAASYGHYGYYHLLSGLDLPLVNQDQAHRFFDNHLNKEFITYGNPNNLKDIGLRIKPHFFRRYYRNNHLFFKCYRYIEKKLLKFIPNKFDSYNKLGYASNWVSIDDSLTQLIVRSENSIRSIFKYGFLVDELFIPTLINLHPNFKKRIYFKKPVHNIPYEFQGNLRYINWWDGNPYIWKLNNFDQLLKAKDMGHLFSRKFDDTVDNEIINKVFNYVM